MSNKLDDLRAELEHAQKEKEIWQHREERAKQKLRYQRSAKDRARTHRLIQYGAAFECNYKELSLLTDEEIFRLIERILELPQVMTIIRQPIEIHAERGD